MRHLLSFFLATLMALTATTTFAQNKKNNDYNLQKAYDVLKEDKDKDTA